MLGRHWPVIGLVAAAGLGLAACGGSGYEYVSNQDAGLHFRVPEAWSVIEVDTTDEDVPETVTGAGEWVRLLDRSPQPGLANLEAVRPQYPVGLASVTPLTTNQERDDLDYTFLRSMALGGDQDPLAVASEADGNIDLVSIEDVTTESGLRGERIVFTVTQEDGGLVTLDHTAMVNPLTTEIYRLFLKCESHCYEANRDEIDDIVESWTIEQDQ